MIWSRSKLLTKLGWDEMRWDEMRWRELIGSFFLSFFLSLDPKQTEVWIQALRSHHLIPNQALSLLPIHGSKLRVRREAWIKSDEMRWRELNGSKADWSLDPSSQISSSDPNQALSLLLIHGSELRDKKRSLGQIRWDLRALGSKANWSLDPSSQISSSDPQPSSLSCSDPWISISEEKRAWDGSHP